MQTPDKVIQLYKGKITIHFFEAQHRYLVANTNVRPPSVTGVTGKLDKSRFLIPWAVRLAKEYLVAHEQELKPGECLPIIEEACRQHTIRKQEAADLGTIVHDWVEQHIKGNKPEMPIDQRAVNGIIAFLKWEKDHGVKFTDNERVVYSKKHGYVGKMDAKAVIGRKTYAIDFKTSNGVYNDYRYQIAAYRAADEEESGKAYSGKENLIVSFGKDTAEFTITTCKDHDKDFAAFLGLLHVWYRERELDAEWRANH